MALDIWWRTTQIAKEETQSYHMGHSFQLAGFFYMHYPHRHDRTYQGLCYTSCGALVGTRYSSMGPPWRINPMNHCTMEQHLTPRISESDVLTHSNVINARSKPLIKSSHDRKSKTLLVSKQSQVKIHKHVVPSIILQQQSEIFYSKKSYGITCTMMIIKTHWNSFVIRRKMILFNDAFNTFLLRVIGYIFYHITCTLMIIKTHWKFCH